MKNKDDKIEFDMSLLNLKELIKVYENIDDFLRFLNEKKIITEKKADKNE